MPVASGLGGPEMPRRKHRNHPQAITAPAFVPAVQGDPEWTPSHTLERQIVSARQEMGPERWAALNAEWL